MCWSSKGIPYLIGIGLAAACACAGKAGDAPSPAQDGAVDTPVEGRGKAPPPDPSDALPIDRPARGDVAPDASRDGATDALLAAGGVDGFRWELPCKGADFVTEVACPWDVSKWQ